MPTITVSIIGATGYTGLELLRLLQAHSGVTVKHLASHSYKGEQIDDIWPHLQGVCNLPLSDLPHQQIADESDVVFVALPHGQSQVVIPHMISRTKIIDLGSDYRVQDLSLYKQFYGEHSDTDNVTAFVYGLPELGRENIADAHNVANPGCFALATQLALYPLRDHIEHAHVQAITGSSGLGKTPSEGGHHPVRNHNLKSYKIGTHRHLAEILQSTALDKHQVTFVPTSGPFTRGIHLTAFVQTGLHESDARQLFMDQYQSTPFVRLKEVVALADIVGSNYCDVSIQTIENTAVVQVAIDNLVKGAAGTAVQNMNLMCGMEEEEGLRSLSPVFP